MHGNRQNGVALVSLLILVAVVGISLSVTGIVWEQATRRERESELLFIGDQYRSAIQQYYFAGSGIRQYPKHLTDLLLDNRFLEPRRYLRSLYADPLTGRNDWGLIPAPTGGIMGIYSIADGRPIKQADFPERLGIIGGSTYQGWRFEFIDDVKK